MKKNPFYNFLFYVFVFISIIFITIKPYTFVNSVRAVFAYIFAPSFVLKPQQKFSNIYDRIYSIIFSSMEMENLRKENIYLKSKMVFLETLINENEKLSKLLNLKKELNFNFFFAKIISYNPYNPYLFVYINKGASDGVRLYNPVLSFFNDRWVLIGRVSELHNNFSKVTLLTTPGFSFIADTHSSRGLLVGDGSKLVYKFIEGDIKLGDSVYSSKISMTFPSFLFVGNITDIHQIGSVRYAIVESFKIKDIDFVCVMDFKPYTEVSEEL
jgi:rod shape-determining protein MreC